MLEHKMTKNNITLPYDFCLGTMILAAYRFCINCLLFVEVYNSILKSQEK